MKQYTFKDGTKIIASTKEEAQIQHKALAANKKEDVPSFLLIPTDKVPNKSWLLKYKQMLFVNDNTIGIKQGMKKPKLAKSIKKIQDFVKVDDKPEIDMSVINKWAKKNLNLTDEGLGKDHWKNPKNGEVYYTWDAAKRLAKKVPGFHLPTAEEWNQLAEACGGVCLSPSEKTVDKDYDNCENLKKLLKIKLVGHYVGSFYSVGSYSFFWTATENRSSNAYYRYLGTGAFLSSSNFNKNYGFSVRLVADS